DKEPSGASPKTYSRGSSLVGALFSTGEPRVLQDSFESFSSNDPTLHSLLNLMVSSGHLWSDQVCNEDTYLKSRLGLFLETWTEGLSVVLLEGKVASNRTLQIWDDRTKLGQEMKLALDSILKLLPEEDVCVVGILVREPLIEFFIMKICAEGTYILRRFAVCYIATDPLNVLPIVTLMKSFQHAQLKVKKTVSAIRRVKVRPSTSPKVPLSWIRPSFNKPTRTLVRDGE
ncbi:hypothetical protein BC939DRAFT_513750, partial [Gamsiella multidivaricata]|uniref:uncharacterized protein n=1 Tax=Gamsiella multidivaricata TaxID=101098 RepID=UPI00221FA042